MKYFPLQEKRTLITNLQSPRTVAEAIAESRNAAADGADAIAIELRSLRREDRNEDSFRAIIQSVPLPFMFLLYRNDQVESLADEPRQELLLAAARAGAGMIDVMGDLFDPSPDERTRKPAAIRQQQALIEQLHAIGSQVIMSSHPLRPMTSDEVVEQLQDFASRGADVVKIVTKVNTDAEFAESIRTTLRLHRELSRPFVHLCGGRFSRIQRMTGTALGVAITFGVHEYHDYASYNQPTIRAFRKVQENMQWSVFHDGAL